MDESKDSRHRGPVDSLKKFPVMELFGPTIQGEGALAGRMTHFVRFGGCGYRCTWCDSMHAVEPDQISAGKIMMSAKEIYWKLHYREFAPWVTLTGGDPVFHDLYDLIAYQSRNINTVPFKWAVETQGELWKPWLTRCDLVTVSPKPPSSGMQDKLDLHVLREYIETIGTSVQYDFNYSRLAFKFVVFNKQDLDWAANVLMQLQDSEKVPLYISIGTTPTEGYGDKDGKAKAFILARMQEVYDMVLAHKEFKRACVLPQLHVLAWGTKKGV